MWHGERELSVHSHKHVPKVREAVKGHFFFFKVCDVSMH